MTTIELKKDLIDKISAINDVSFLKAIQTILEKQSHTLILNLSEEVKQEIVASQKEVSNGKFIENTELDKEVAVWLSGK